MTHFPVSSRWYNWDMPKPSPFKVRPNLLPKSDPRYKKWRESLKKRPPPWDAGHTKETHPGLKKISEARKRIDNFAKWRQHARENGLIPASYPPFEKTKDLATLIDLTLGDGHINKFPRTEKLFIYSRILTTSPFQTETRNY